MKVAVTGATGIVGRFVVARLVAEGARVRALARASSDRSGLPDAVEWHIGDIADGAARKALVQDADAVVHCAYQHAPGRYRGGEGDDLAGFWRANLLAGVDLMSCASRAGVPRFVLLSSRAVFGRDTPASGPVDESVRPVPDSHYGALKLALEAHASAFAATEGVGYASLRPTGVYGIVHPLARSKWFDLACAVAGNRPLPAARLATEVHGDDVAAAVSILLAAPVEAIAGAVFNCSDLAVDTRAVMAALSERLGVRVDLPPPAANALRHPMATPALDALGWRPGGERRLAHTIDQLTAAVR